VYNASMNRRIYLVLIVLLFGASIWALISSFISNTPAPNAPGPANILNPQPAQQ
jgi:zona occludens toxin (predicted ATPase)